MFIFLKSDAFANVAGRSKDKSEGSDLTDINAQKSVPIRRPYRGIQIKKDIYATLSIRKPDGKPLPLFKSGSALQGNSTSGGIGTVTEYADFILQSVQDERSEKQQIIETFGDPYVYFFGERPRIMTMSGLLINTEDFNWRSQFWENYHENLRGTKLVQQNARAYLSFDTIVVEGYPLQASAVDDANTPHSIPFQLTMLVTAYYDWSSIGQTRFPGFGQGVNLGVLNQELSDRRGKFVSTGADVRTMNLQASLGSGGILSTLRGGIRAVNEAVSTVRGFTNAIGSVVGGRNVRVPLGVAGFLQTTGGAQIAAGSILPGAATAAQFAAATGELEGFRGSVTLRVPASSTYAPSWVSQITKGPRGYIHENLDEYPTRGQPQSLLDTSLLTKSQQVDLQARLRGRQATLTEANVSAKAQTLIEQGGGLIGDLAEAVDFAKSAFSMVLTGSAFIQDPEGSVAAVFGGGVGLGGASAARIASRSAQLAALGIKTSANAGVQSQFIGFKAGNTFNNLLTGTKEVLDGSDFSLADGDPLPAGAAAAIGGAYQSNQYLTQDGSGDSDFEPVYGSKDYAALLSAAALQEGEVGFTEENVQASLDEVYGNNDDAPDGTDIDPASFEEVYGTGSTASSIRSPEEIAAVLQSLQQGSVPNDEDTSGIRGVDDDGAQINPIV